MPKIVKVGHPALRKVSKPVVEKELSGAALKSLLGDLSAALATREDGVGLSAPQIAVNKRVFVVSGRVFDKDWLSDKKSAEGKTYTDQYFINPKVIKASKKVAEAEEGCLSIPNTYGLVKRPANVTIEFTDPSGKKRTRGAGGLLARIFQHEIDHLDGILFTDKATNIKKAKDTNENQEF